ncbi:extracellular solute-binding protein [Paenibacillus lignilyticus]|uniref:Extracellular solute-binding protein n=1 Tax=Paenibacillus lignilyticus TaxID=1172615 RepID=A0ABS5CGS1_9BACL|nr:extracellular solute-binding protein [Paenibacillus lignilyticus]MBP3965076.1 extracellular solute-binding protein [Paenibacillus lignilyticus]
MKTKKTALILLAITMMLSLILAGCSKDNGNNTQPPASSETDQDAGGNKEGNEVSKGDDAASSADFKFGSEPVDFSFYAHYDWWTTEPWGNDVTSKWVKENLKVNVTPIQSGGTAKQKLSTMLASDDLPDVIIMDRNAEVEKLRAAGKLVAFDDYLDKYPNLKKWAGDKTLNMLRSPDGKLYQFPNWYTSRPNGNAGYLINKNIYNELGSPKLETFDDLYAYLRLVKEKYPDVVPFETDIDGQGVHIFTSGMENGFSPSYIGVRGVPNGDKLESVYAHPAFIEAVKFASRLYREKLMTQDAMTQKKEQVNEKMKNGRVAVYLSYSSMEPSMSEGNTLLKQQDPNGGYEMIWPLHKDGVDKNQVFPNTFNSLGWNVNVITTAAKNPEGIFAYLDWMTGEEGQSVMMFGPPGRYWDTRDDKGAPIPNDKWKNTPQAEKDKDKMGIFNWVGNTTFVDTTKTEIEMALPPEKQNWASVQQNNVSWKTSQDTTAFVNLDPPTDSEEGIAATAIEDLFKKYFAKAIFAGSDAEVDTILKELNDNAMELGLEKLLAYKTEQWQANLQKMNGQ